MPGIYNRIAHKQELAGLVEDRHRSRRFAVVPPDFANPDDTAPDLGAMEHNGDLNPVHAPLLRDSAYESIRDAIRYGALKPGEALSETRLSTWLGVSRTPVREALQRLARQGMVQIIPGRAVTVAAPSIEDTLNAIQVRAILEPVVVRLATEAISSSRLEDLWEALTIMEAAVKTGDRAAWSHADTQYHEIITTACPNPLLGELSLQIRNRVSFIAIDSKTSPERLAACTLEHRRIVEHMTERNAAAAEEAMREHIHQLLQSSVQKFSFR